MGIIYKIVVNDYIYYGSTIQQLCKRQARHNHNLKHNPIQKLYVECINNNIDNIKCEVVEECNNSIIRERENFYISNCNNSLNSRLALCTEERKKEINRKYMQSEKGKLGKKIRDARYAENHKEELRLRKKAYYQKNKMKL